MSRFVRYSFFFFFNDTATTEIYTLSLHDALPIFDVLGRVRGHPVHGVPRGRRIRRPTIPSGIHRGHRVRLSPAGGDRKSTRLNSSHSQISYAVFCLKKKKTTSHSLPTLSTTSIWH